jgi:hypothetical protein
MRVFIFKIIFHLLACSAVLGQKKEFTGYYVNLQGDTIKGALNYRQWKFNPSEVEFRSNSSVLMLTPQNAREFYTDGYETYISYKGSRLINPIESNGNPAKNDSASRFSELSAFLKLIYTSKEAKLFVYQDKERVNLYFQQPGGMITELLYKVYKTNAGFRSSPLFQQQLMNAFTEVILQRGMREDIATLKYDAAEVMHFFSNLFGKGTLPRKKSLYPAESFIGAGISINSIKTSVPALSYKAQASPVILLGTTLYHQRSYGRWYWLPSLKIYSFKNTSDFLDNNNAVTTLKSGLILNPVLRLGRNLINGSSLRWGIYAGGGFLYVTKQEISKKMNGQEIQFDYNKDKTNFNVAVGTELRIKSFKIWVDYTPPVKIYLPQYDGSGFGKHFNIQAGVAWIIKK